MSKLVQALFSIMNAVTEKTLIEIRAYKVEVDRRLEAKMRAFKDDIKKDEELSSALAVSIAALEKAHPEFPGDTFKTSVSKMEYGKVNEFVSNAVKGITKEKFTASDIQDALEAKGFLIDTKKISGALRRLEKRETVKMIRPGQGRSFSLYCKA